MRRNVFSLSLALASLISPVMAQEVVSARAGLIHEAEGVVKINGEEYHQEGLRFNSMKEGDTLSTEAGRAEILLNAGSILRVGEDSSFNLVAASLTDTRVKLESGMIIVEVAELPKETSVTLDVNGQEIALRKRGLYEFQSENPARIRVYDGELTLAAADGANVRIAKGRQYSLDSTNTQVAKFDIDDDNSALYRWGARRARTLVAATQTLPRSSMMFSNTGFYNGAWAYNPLLGMYVYISRGGIYSPYANVIYIPMGRPSGVAPSFPGSSGGNSTFGIGNATPSYVGGGSASVGSSGRAVSAPSAPAVSSGGSSGGGGRSR